MWKKKNKRYNIIQRYWNSVVLQKKTKDPYAKDP